jgi:hypothetical protein
MYNTQSMKIFYTLLLVFCGFIISGQISHRPGQLKLNSPLPIDSSDTKLGIYFNVEKDTTYTVYWKVIKDPNTWKSSWATYVCDKVLCYGENRDANSVENEMGQGEHLFEFHFKPYAVAGCTEVELVLYGDSRFSEEIYRVKIDINGCAQNEDITHSPDLLKINTPDVIDSLTDVKVDINFNIIKDTTYTVYWKVEKDAATWNNAWATRVCDLFTCFGDNLDKGPFENLMEKGNYLFQVHFLPYGVPGCTVVDLVLYGDSRFSEELYRVKIDINDCLTVGAININLNDQVKLYPNPANEYFQLSNDENVDKIKVYNIFGSEVKSFFHYKNAQHIIGDLKSGMYFVKMLDTNNKIIKTVKLNKVFSGT